MENITTRTPRTTTRTRTTFVAIGDPFPGLKMKEITAAIIMNALERYRWTKVSD